MNIFKKLQKIGNALMMPVSVLPAAGIIVALGRLLIANDSVLGDAGRIMYNAGISVFDNLPLIFALGVVIGLTDEAFAVLSAGGGYVIFDKVLTTMAEIFDIMNKTDGSIELINTGVLGGIIIGVVAASCYKRFHKTELPSYLGFFAGKRLVPILTGLSSLLIGVLLAVIWPPIQVLSNNLAKVAMNSSLGPAFYAAGKRALIPVGLHHVYYPPFLYEFGRFVTASGEILRGETARYFAGDPTAGYFMAAEYPLMLFGLPAAAFAMYLRADTHKKKAVAGVMSTAALTSILTGITEPIEFSFILVAPLLYVFHIIGGFIAGLLTKLFSIRLGYTFSASLIDYFLGISNMENSFEFWLIVGPIIGVLYFLVFYFAIPIFDFNTPGRSGIEDNLDEEFSSNTIVEEQEELDTDDRTKSFIQACGGLSNIEGVDSCVTRLRMEVEDDTRIDENKLKELGAVDVVKIRGGVQIIIGPECDELKDKIKELL